MKSFSQFIQEEKKKNKIIAKRVPDGYSEGKYTWAIGTEGPYDFIIIDSGFSSKASAMAMIKRIEQSEQNV